MHNLPMKRKSNLFLRIKMFFEKLFASKAEIKDDDYQEINIEKRIQKRNFGDDIKIEGIKNEALIKIEIQNKRNKLLEKIAENPELLNNLSMDELTEIENIYDEEIEKLKKNT